MDIIIKPFAQEHKKQILQYIILFFNTHHMKIEEIDTHANLLNWISEGHEFYEILGDDELIGFVHVCMRGPTACWIENIFVDERFRRRGVASKAIALIEEILRERNIDGICIDVVPDNLPALKLYHHLGYNRLSMITIRKDMRPFTVDCTEQIHDMKFYVKHFED